MQYMDEGSSQLRRRRYLRTVRLLLLLRLNPEFASLVRALAMKATNHVAAALVEGAATMATWSRRKISWLRRDRMGRR